MGRRNYDNEKENEEILITRAKIFIPLALLWGAMIMLTILSKMQFQLDKLKFVEGKNMKTNNLLKTTKDVLDMLDLFYANIHLNKKLKKENRHKNTKQHGKD